MRGDNLAKDRSIGRDKVDHAIRKSGLLEDLVDLKVGEHCSITWLPNCAIALEIEEERRETVN